MAVVVAGVWVGLSVVVEGHLVVVGAGVGRCNALVIAATETTGLLDLQASAAGVGVFWFGVPETVLVRAMVRVAAARATVKAVSE